MTFSAGPRGRLFLLGARGLSVFNKKLPASNMLPCMNVQKKGFAGLRTYFTLLNLAFSFIVHITLLPNLYWFVIIISDLLFISL